jgi:DNA topoisomerase VI subunit B
MDRPRRTVRPTAKLAQALAPEPKVPARTTKAKPAPDPVDPQKQLKMLLESSKSDLVSLDMHVCTRFLSL